MRHFYLSDSQWEAIKPHLPPDQGRKRRVDDRRVISGIIRRWNTGFIQRSIIVTIAGRRAASGSICSARLSERYRTKPPWRR